MARNLAQNSTGNRELQRPQRALDEIESLPAPAELLAYLRSHGTALSPETLVYLARSAAANRAPNVLEECGRLLNGMPIDNGAFTRGPCEPIITKHAVLFGFSRTVDDRTEFRARCHAALWAAILAGPARPYFEERFYAALKGLVIDVGKSMAAERARHGLDGPDTGESSEFDAVVSVEGVDDPISGLVTREIELAVRRLPAAERDAAWLAWVMDWKIESNEESDLQTVSRALGIGGRMVHKRLKAAASMLRRDPIIARIMDDHGWS